MLYFLYNQKLFRGQSRAMKNFTYPHFLDEIFMALEQNGIRAVLVGGYVRDFFLSLPSKDIDIELYHASSLEQITKLLQKFATPNSVGKNFAVIKLHYKGYNLDFSLPRRDNKVAKGHKGFEIVIDAELNFSEASKRRDFTINAVGYDVIEKKILDPHGGLKDLQNKRLRAVDLQSFSEDPLRLLRAVGFASRFLFEIEEQLFALMQTMVAKKQLHELPKERVFEELKKILLKAKRPSIAFRLLKKLHCSAFGFDLLFGLEEKKFLQTLTSLDNFAAMPKEKLSSQEHLEIMFALLVKELQKPQDFITQLTTNKQLQKSVLTLHSLHFDLDDLSDYAIYKLATQVNIRHYLLYLKALYPADKKITELEKRAKELGVYERALEPLVGGDDLIKLGYKPSKAFKEILKELYEKQLREGIDKKEKLLNLLVKHSSCT